MVILFQKRPVLGEYTHDGKNRDENLDAME